MTNRVFGTITAALLIFALTFLTRSVSSDGQNVPVDDLAGPIIVWHSWVGERGEVLSQTMLKFEESHPGIDVVLVNLPLDELLDRYSSAVVNGFGPDVLIGPGEWLIPLQEANLLSPVEPEIEVQINGWFRPETSRILRNEDTLYGVPFALRTWALYYNKTTVQKAATTLDELLVQAGEGAGVGVGTSFESALWGLGASGGQIYDENGEVVLDAGALTSWLTWMRNAQNNPAFVMSTNQEGLRGLFVSGELSYLVDESEALLGLLEGLEKGTLGVRTLPSGPSGSATPLLRTEAIFFSPASSARQGQAAQRLALFLVGKEQQTLLMRRANLVPSNRDVRINNRLNPEIAAFSAQIRTAVPWTNDPRLSWLLRTGDETYVQAIEGVLTPVEAADDLFAKLEVFNQQP